MQTVENKHSLLGPESFSEMERIADISQVEFLNNYIKKGQPVILEGFARKWPAFQKWSFEYFSNRSFNEMVPAKIGDHIGDDQKCVAVGFKKYFQDIIKNPNQAGAVNPYLTNFDLFKEFPDLIEDVDFSILNGSKVLVYQRTHFGPAGTVSGYHIDYADNMLAQIRGKKRIRLINSKYKNRMYPKKCFKYFTLISQIDPKNYNEEKFPLFKNTPAYIGDLNAGDIVFIPRRWWHNVEAVSASITFANWGMSTFDLIRDGLPETLKRALHYLGLYRKGNCTCHRYELTSGKQF